MMVENLVDTTYKRYKKISLWIIAGLMLIGLFIMSVAQQMSWLTPLVISVVFSLVTSIALAEAWRGVAKSSPSSLAKLYMAASGIRMMLAFLTFLIYCLVVRQREAIISFVIIFFAFYVALLIFDCIYFSKIEKRNIKL